MQYRSPAHCQVELLPLRRLRRERVTSPDERKRNALPPKNALTFRFELAIGASLSADDRSDAFFEFAELGHLRRACGTETISWEISVVHQTRYKNDVVHEVEIAAPDLSQYFPAAFFGRFRVAPQILLPLRARKSPQRTSGRNRLRINNVALHSILSPSCASWSMYRELWLQPRPSFVLRAVPSLPSSSFAPRPPVAGGLHAHKGALKKLGASPGYKVTLIKTYCTLAHNVSAAPEARISFFSTQHASMDLAKTGELPPILRRDAVEAVNAGGGEGFATILAAINPPAGRCGC